MDSVLVKHLSPRVARRETWKAMSQQTLRPRRREEGRVYAWSMPSPIETWIQKNLVLPGMGTGPVGYSASMRDEGPSTSLLFIACSHVIV